MSSNALTTTSEVDPAVGVVYQRRLLKAPQPKYIYSKWGENYDIGAKQGNTMKFRRYSRLAAATTPITEGITPSGRKLAKVDITAQVSQYGDFVTITDVVDLTTEDPVIMQATDLQNDQINNTVDQLVRDYLCASASSTTCSNGSGTVTLLNKTDIDGVVQTLRANDADYMYDRVTASTGVGTSPIRAAYAGLADTDLENDLRNVSGYVDVTAYSSDASVSPAEVGSTGGVRWETSTQGYVSSTNYYCPILGRDASNKPFAIIGLGGGNAQSIIKAFGSGGTSDPIDQRATVGWKMWQACRILQDLYVHVLICTNA